MGRVWELKIEERPWTVNAARNWHFHKLAKNVKYWRDSFCKLSNEENIPPLNAVCIEVIPIVKDKRLQDTAACALAAKAAIDGLVDSGIIPDDRREYLKWIKFYPCVNQTGVNAMIIRILEVSENEEADFYWSPDS